MLEFLQGNTGIILAAMKTGITTFTPRHTIMGKGVVYVRPFDTTLPLRPIEVEFENNKCCIEIHNSSDSTVEFLFGNEMAYFDARLKGLVQANNSIHFPIDQYLHNVLFFKIQFRGVHEVDMHEIKCTLISGVICYVGYTKVITFFFTVSSFSIEMTLLGIH